MEKTYRSKVSTGLLIFIYAVIIASTVPIAYSGEVVKSVIFAALIIVPITFYMFNIKYTIRGTSLIVRDGIISHTYDINDIRSIRPTHTLLSAPAASLDRLEIKFSRNTLIVSPKHKEDFIRHLCEASQNEIKQL